MAQSHVLTRCPACGARNRMPVARVGLVGRCGSCREPLPRDGFYAEWPVEVTDGKFDALTRMSPHAVLVDFWAEWCAPCRQVAPVLEQLAAKWADRLLVAKLDTEAHPLTPERFGVRSIPTMVLLRKGLEVERIVGALPLPALEQRLERWV
jgi:thioredoxin 2